MEELVSTLLASTPDPRKKRSELATLPFLFAVDHCFSKSGQGTVLTGTVLRGCTRVGEVLLERPYNLSHSLWYEVSFAQGSCAGRNGSIYWGSTGFCTPVFILSGIISLSQYEWNDPPLNRCHHRGSRFAWNWRNWLGVKFASHYSVPVFLQVFLWKLKVIISFLVCHICLPQGRL